MEDKINEVCQKLNLERYSQHPKLRNLASKLKIKPEIIVLIALIIFLLIIVLTNLGNKVLFLIFGLLYPTYESFKAIRIKKLDDDKKWLTYWITFGVLYYMKPMIAMILYFFPLIDLLITIILFSIYFEKINGYIYIYEFMEKLLDNVDLSYLEFQFKNLFINVKKNN